MEKLNITCIIASEESGGKVSVFEEIVGAKSGPPLHRHNNQLEVFHVLTGQIRFQIEDETKDVGPGGVAVIPPGKAHAFVNLRDKPSTIHFELLPSGTSETFFEKLTSGDFEDLHELFEGHDLGLLGPPIERPS